MPLWGTSEMPRPQMSSKKSNASKYARLRKMFWKHTSRGPSFVNGAHESDPGGTH